MISFAVGSTNSNENIVENTDMKFTSIKPPTLKNNRERIGKQNRNINQKGYQSFLKEKSLREYVNSINNEHNLSYR